MSKNIATREAYGQALVELGASCDKVVVLDADLSKSTKTAKFGETYPERFFNMGIAEQNMMGTAAGFAIAGKIPFASTFAIFATGRAYEQVRNTIAYPALPVVVAATHAGLTVGPDGGSHQSIEDVALMRVIPNMTVLVPADAEETKQMVHAAKDYGAPVYLRLGRVAVPQLFDESYSFEVGKATILRKGTDVTIAACGIMVAKALAAADQLAEEGISASVVNVSTIKPLDCDTLLALAEQTGAFVVAEEHSVVGGLTEAVAGLMSRSCPVPVIPVAIEDIFGQSGTPDELLTSYGLTVEALLEKARTAINLK